MLILQIIGGWLAVSSVCLNVYYFLTIAHQRKLLAEYREELHNMKLTVKEVDQEIGHIITWHKQHTEAIKQLQYKTKEL